MTLVHQLILGYLIFGLVTAYLLDRKQMRKHVPYGSFPSIHRLKTIRISVYVLSIFLSGGLAVWFSMEKIRMWFWSDKNGEEV